MQLLDINLQQKLTRQLVNSLLELNDCNPIHLVSDGVLDGVVRGGEQFGVLELTADVDATLIVDWENLQEVGEVVLVVDILGVLG